ncbi:MAG: hypothetical protein JXJ22_10230 [Bacteroidales bacterium]|nr:hypothetical protein [Bacteroidales bacterium]
MKRIITFRYHNNIERNFNFLQLLKQLNPDIEIYGVFGGTEELYNQSKEQLNKVLTHNYYVDKKDNEWKWRYSDLVYQLWYRDVGHKVKFDYMHSIEWDLLLLDSLDNLYSHVPQDSVAVSGLIPLEKIIDKWFWTSDEGQKKDWYTLMEYFKTTLNYNQKPFGIIGPGASFPKLFWEKIMDISIPEICIDEIKLPLLAQSFGFNLVDTGFFKKWFSKREAKFFNANNKDIKVKIIKKELKKINGRRVFHPFREDITYSQLKEFIDLKK